MRFLSCFLAICLMGCAGKNNSGAPVPGKTLVLPHATGPLLSCYGYSREGDTLRLHLRTTDTVVTGELYVHYAGKDRNRGTLSGQMRGDTLIADYEFMSEGVLSVRQVAFLHRGGGFIEGFGPGVQTDNGTRFTATGQIIFSGDRVLEAIPCP